MITFRNQMTMSFSRKGWYICCYFQDGLIRQNSRVMMKKAKYEKQRQIDVSGIIIPADWDSNGKVKAYAISTFNEKEYVVKNMDEGEDLECFLGKKANIKGELIQSETLQIIRIKSISVI